MKKLSEDHFIIGQLVQIDMEFRLTDGQLADPAAITLKIMQPSGAVQQYSKANMTQVATGRWRMFYAITQERRHFLRCESTSSPQTADEYQFDVEESPFND